MQKLFREALTQSADYGRLERKIRDGVTPVSVFGVCDGQKTHLAAALTEDRPLLIITHSLASAEIIRQDYEFYTGGHMALFPAREQNLQAAFQTGDWVRRRMEALQELLDGTARAAVAPLDAVLYTIPPREVTQEARIVLTPGMRIDIRQLTERLVLCGYSAVSAVQGKGEFYVHGGLVDLFPDDSEQPLRLDFFDDELESIRSVDPVSQRTVGTVERAVILPRRELCVSAQQCAEAGERLKEELLRFNRTCRSRDAVTSATDTFIPMAEKLKNGVLPAGADQLIAYFFPQYTSLLDYMPADTLVVFDEIKLLRERAKNAEEEFSRVLTSLMEEGRALLKHGQMFTGFERLFSRAQKQQIVTMQSISGTVEGLESRAVFRLEGRVMQSFHGKPDFLMQEIRALQNGGYRTVLCAGTQARAERLEKELLEAGISVKRFRRGDRAIGEGEAAIIEGSVARGYDYPRLHFAVIAEHDLFALAKHTARAPLKRKNGLESFADLKTGDFVVHETNGVARYMGIVKIETDGVKRDYLFLQFRNDDRCYVPVDQMSRVQKYIAPDDAAPQLSRLGTQEWNKTKARVRKSIADLTEKLLALYRARENTPGIPFDPDTPWQRAFEEDFPYEETPDQVRCVQEIKADMESPRAMDRLLCGDVGYGKTEVALRAMFKAVMSGKQAALLAPTTILAEQHFQTLQARLVNFEAVRVESISRFKTAKEQKRILADLAEGKIDMIVGTHRLLGKDVQFKRLGLLVVDEEQRFGVAHKEKIKELKSNIDVLTMSATPIPRTLNMALSGIRDMSLLETPPQERYPVQTYVLEYADAIVRDAILREIDRGGQVFYLFNRVQGIDLFAEHLRTLVPQARIAVAHGQMNEKMLEEIVLDFYNGEYDVLLCTTIIENGVDIPGANTIIVQDAHRLGLAQLYQLRGRVGRSNRLAYAYFTVPPLHSLSEEAVKRLQTIEEFTQMGSGFKIALRDLEIRGAGNLLGGEQHGHISHIGYELYCKMVRESVDEGLGRKKKETPFATVEVKINAYLPDDWISSESVRFATYRRISELTDREDVNEMREELTDRFGPLPPAADALLAVAYLRALGGRTGVSLIRQEKNDFMLFFPKPDLQNVMRAVSLMEERCRVSAGSVFSVTLKAEGKTDAEKLEPVIRFLEEIGQAPEERP